MRILYYQWNVFNNLDILTALATLGYRTDTFTEIDEIEQHDIRNYDFVFSVNYFISISNYCQSQGIRYVCWTCDNPLISMYDQSVFNSCNYIFAFDKTNVLEFEQMGVQHIWYLPLAVNVDRLDKVIATADQQPDQYAGDIVFVGSLYERNTYDKMSDKLPEYLRGYLDATMEAQMNISGGNIIEDMLTTPILEEIQQYFELEKTDDAFSNLSLIFQTTVLGFKIAQQQRRRSLIELSKRHQVNVYTLSDTSDLIRVHNCGSADYWNVMPKVFHESKINLNYTIPNIKSGIPLRMWDVLGCGGFLLTNYQAEIPYYFKDGEDLVCFDGIEDLKDKADYYLVHEDERREIAQNGYDTVKNGHSYVDRIMEIMDTIGE